MYKLLLCWRYLRTRYIALASIISVMLGVATMIVVNSVMAGFSREMEDRLRGFHCDVSIVCRSMDGMPDLESPEFLSNGDDQVTTVRKRIQKTVGELIEGMTPTVMVPAMINIQSRGTSINAQVELVGIDEETQSQVSDFGKYVQHPENRKKMSFDLREGGYDTRDHQAGPDAPERVEMRYAGWAYRRAKFAKQLKQHPAPQPTAPSESFQPDPFQLHRQSEVPRENAASPPMGSQDVPGPTAAEAPVPTDPFAGRTQAPQFDPTKEQHDGVVLGMALASFRTPDGKEHFRLLPGDDVRLMLPTAGTPPKVISNVFTVVDFYESKMSEQDARVVFVRLRDLQGLRGMIDPTTGRGRISAVQIKVKPGVDPAIVRDKLRTKFPADFYVVGTWRDHRRELLAAVQMETAVLNVLLFLIITVAGFGILAIFLMIVVEKTRDIGILKSLGASGRGVMGIFLTYGLSLGIIGSGVGLVLGLLFVGHINQIADFYKIPTIVNPLTVAWIVGGAITIAVLASVLPALRAALLHPVEALRYE